MVCLLCLDCIAEISIIYLLSDLFRYLYFISFKSLVLLKLSSLMLDTALKNLSRLLTIYQLPAFIYLLFSLLGYCSWASDSSLDTYALYTYNLCELKCFCCFFACNSAMLYNESQRCKVSKDWFVSCIALHPHVET